MSDAWYYAEGDKAVGPITLADLIAILSRVSTAQSVPVWRDGLPNWVEAKDVPELAPHVIKPPPLPIKPTTSATNQVAQKPELTWQRAISVWWLLYWRGIIGAIVISTIVGLAIRLIGSLVGVNDEAIKFTSTVVGLLFGFVWVIVVVQMALRKHYRDFRLALIPDVPNVFKAQELEPTLSRATRVWWLISWRYLAGYIAIYAIVVWPISLGFQVIQMQNWAIQFTVSFAIGLVISFVWLIVVLQMALQKQYRHFKIAVVPLTPAIAV